MGRYCLVLTLIALSVIRESPSRDRSGEAHVLYLAYDSARKVGNFALAEEKLRMILDGDFHLPDLNLAVVHNALGLVCYERGRLQEAMEHYRRAESYSLRAGPSSRHARVNIINNLAILYNWLGDYATAMDYYGRSIRLLDSIPDHDTEYFRMLSMVQLNQGIAYSQLERFGEARAILLECEKIKREHGLPYLGSVYFNLARVNRELGDVDAAGSYYRQSIERWIAEYDTGHYELANVYLEFGMFLAEGEQWAPGQEYLEKALRNYRANYGESHSLTARCYQQMAALFLEVGDYERSLEMIRAAFISVSPGYRDTGMMDNPVPEGSLHNMTLLKILATKTEVLEYAAGRQRDDGRRREYLLAALASNRRSIEVLYRLQDSYVSGESRTYLISRQKELFATGIRLNIGMNELTSDERYLEEAYLTAAGGKSNELLYEMRTKEWLYLETLPDSTARTVLELKQLSEYYSNLIEYESQQLAPDPARLMAWQQQLFHYRDSFSRQMDRLRSDYPPIASFESLGKDLTIERVRRDLGRKESLVEYFISPGADGPGDLYVFVVTRNGCHYYHDCLDSSFQTHLDVLRDRLFGFVPFEADQYSWEELKRSLYELYRLLVGPVEEHFAGDGLIIVPDEQLALIPFDALVTSHEPEPHFDYTGVSYMVRHYHISYLINSRLTKAGSHPGLRFPRVYAINPDYREGSSGRTLPGASREVDRIMGLAGGRLLDGPVDKMQVMNILEQHGIIHMAMHARSGEESGRSPHFHFPGTGDSLFSDRLYDFEIGALNLSSPLVVLSSCESAAGELVAGEGMISLSRSFLQAGAGSVVHSLWKVEDIRGGSLMPGYYGYLKEGINKNRALTIAKREFLNAAIMSLNHPYYWAAYQLTGDTSPLVDRSFRLVWLLVIVPVITMGYFLIRRIFSPSSRASSPAMPE